MKGAPLVPEFRLSDETGGLGLSCTESGVSLAGAPLLRRTALGFISRPKAEVGALMKAAYGDAFGGADLSPRLAVVADALNKGDLGRARIAAVHLQLPEISWDRAMRIARTEEALAKYDPDEPRDWRGRWTTGSVGAPASPAVPEARQPRRSGPAPRESSPFTSPAPATLGSGPAHLYGGQLIQTGGGGPGDNEPPLDPIDIPEAEPDLPGIRVPQGWDKPAYTTGSLYYPPTRNPTLADGSVWPRATHDAVKKALAPNGGRKPPEVVIYIPIDGLGPPLMGETEDIDFEEPRGYSSVKFIGTPQRTYSRGEETGHAADSIQEAIRLAETNQFSRIYFNRALITSTRGQPPDLILRDLIRPDVFAIVRPEIKIGYIYHPYETLSPGQSIEQREPDYPSSPSMRALEGRRYKFAGLVISPYFKVVD